MIATKGDLGSPAYLESLGVVLQRQLDALVPCGAGITSVESSVILAGVERVRHGIAQIRMWKGQDFNFLNTLQYTIFLYWLAREYFDKYGERELPDRIFALNKALNGTELYYEVPMPDEFLVNHTVGTVFVKATYGSRLVMHQGCTVGRLGEDRPTLEGGAVLFPNSAVLGRCHVRENTVISAGVQLINRDTPGNCVVFSGEGGNPVFKPIDEYFAHRYFCP
ncbi:MAG: hypothetical protein EON90_11340 [Brevundimonas sp.]|nr:MAG: hypothetical protein EON90_11340 [Brevundimonas sp.]